MIIRRTLPLAGSGEGSRVFELVEVIEVIDVRSSR